jgi:hypothetical protein
MACSRQDGIDQAGFSPCHRHRLLGWHVPHLYYEQGTVPEEDVAITVMYTLYLRQLSDQLGEKSKQTPPLKNRRDWLLPEHAGLTA